MSLRNDPEYRSENLRKYYYRDKVEALALLGGKCVVCGITERLHFDHKDPKTKSFDITWAFAHVTKEELLLELEKCQLLCDTHHYEKCAMEGSYQRNKPVGEKHGLSRLRDLDVIYIREMDRLGYTRRAIANEFEVAHSTINNIVNGRTWKHV